jgi:hypothetical protein
MSARITESFAVREVPGKSRGGRQCVQLLEPLEYRVGSADSEERITVPAGFETDFASVPRIFHSFIPPLGKHGRPAIIHDFLYSTEGRGPGITRREPYSRKEADDIFLEAMKVVGVPRLRRSLMYRAVRLGGGSGWGRRD